MKRLTPLNKQSKKARKAYYSSQRGSWHGVDPVTRVVLSGKRYCRSKAKKNMRVALDQCDK